MRLSKAALYAAVLAPVLAHAQTPDSASLKLLTGTSTTSFSTTSYSGLLKPNSCILTANADANLVVEVGTSSVQIHTGVGPNMAPGDYVIQKNNVLTTNFRPVIGDDKQNLLSLASAAVSICGDAYGNEGFKRPQLATIAVNEAKAQNPGPKG